jgi:hypothetical protein
MLISIDVKDAEVAKHLIALKAAINSNSLMCRPEWVVVQGPPVLTLSLTAPHPEREAFEHIKIEGGDAVSFRPK